MKQYDIVIAVAGPTGLMAANQLAKFSINFCILDSNPGPTEQSRAIVVTARSMEIYQQMGISQVAIDEGRFITELAIFIKGKERVSAVIGEFGKGKTDFSYMLAFEQSKNEKLLDKTLQTFNKEVPWNTELLNIIQQENNLELEVKHLGEGHQSTEKINTRYPIGCDGAKSLARQLLNFSFEGGTTFYCR
ncbi:MAG: FAD-dependent monooxygenase [Ferruginibacter sp.]